MPSRRSAPDSFTATAAPRPVLLRPHAAVGRGSVRAAPEMELLVCCARRRLEPAQVERIHALLSGGLDWSALLALAPQHGMLPLLHHHLAAVARDRVPAVERSALENAFIGNAGRALLLTGELTRLLRRLAEHGISALPYKGPVLAVQLYGDVALRQAGDLDILIHLRDLARARELMLEDGYEQSVQLSRDGEAALEKSWCHEIFYREDVGWVEVHWRFTRGFPAFPLQLDTISARLRSVRLGGEEVPGFSAEDLLLVLCVHGAKHRWDRLEWIAGVGELLRTGSGLDWASLLDRAAALGARRSVLLGAALAHELLDAPLSPELAGSVAADRRVRRLTEAVREWVLSAGEAALPPRDAFRFALVEHPRDRAHFLLYWLTTPRLPHDLRWVRIGRASLPLHAVLRPFQVGARVAGWLYERLARVPRRP